MQTFATILLIIGLLGFIFCAFILYRNEKVAGLQLALVELAFGVLESYIKSLDDDEKIDEEYFQKLRDKCDEICSISYNKMLFSLRPLTIEEWLTPEQIVYLKLKF